jgi:hypothetical protein
MLVDSIPSCRQTAPAHIIQWIFGGHDPTTEKNEQLDSHPQESKGRLKEWQKYHLKMSGLSIVTETQEQARTCWELMDRY